MDGARRHYEEASQMEPENPEYKETVKRMRNRKYYRPRGTPAGTLSNDIVPTLAAYRACACYGCCYYFTFSCCEGCMEFDCPD